MLLQSSIVPIVIALIALGIGVYVLARAAADGTPITPTLVTTTLANAQATAAELAGVAFTAAQAAEQLYRSGELEKSERMDEAFAYVRRWYPQLDQLTITRAIEAAVLLVNSIVASLPEKE